jgi:DNA-binding transcriptional ArsR family regulator
VDTACRYGTIQVSDTGPGLPALDPVIHAQPRLRITVALAALGEDDMLTFPRLQELVGMTAGNLATHLRKLEDAGYLMMTKSFRRRSPVTYLALTPLGRRALKDYTAAVRRLLAVPGPDPANHDIDNRAKEEKLR